MEHKVVVRILGPVGSGKSSVYAKLVKGLTDTGAIIKHADEQAWNMLNNSGEVTSADTVLDEFRTEVTFEEVVIRDDYTKSKNQIMQFFAYSHLPPNLQAISKPIALLAQEMDQNLPDGAERVAGLRKLLEAKDCLVRALVAK
ncbi:hypothetical protein pEaSNUABM34_00026 [Erwinia phage pEa_SNUABM_34]|nr:hypothetical protein pEaSNUABM34_00026 [Erwinia phage pEa_SNUABM_34]